MSVEAMLAVHRLPVKTSATAYRVLMVLAEHANKAGGNSWPAIDTIAVEAQTDERTVRRCLSSLQELKLITGERLIGRGRTTVWTLILPTHCNKKEGMKPPFKASKEGATPPFSKLTGKEGITPGIPGNYDVLQDVSYADPVYSAAGKGGVIPPEPKKKERKKAESFGLLVIEEVEVDLLSPIEPPKPKPVRVRASKATEAEIEIGFVAFWSAYPRKEDSYQARVEYGRVIKSGVTPAELLDAVQAFPFNHDAYDKYGKNWLKERAWLDKPGPHSGVARNSKIEHKPSRRDWARPSPPEPDFIETTYVELP